MFQFLVVPPQIGVADIEHRAVRLRGAVYFVNACRTADGTGHRQRQAAAAHRERTVAKSLSRGIDDFALPVVNSFDRVFNARLRDIERLCRRELCPARFFTDRHQIRDDPPQCHKAQEHQHGRDDRNPAPLFSSAIYARKSGEKSLPEAIFTFGIKNQNRRGWTPPFWADPKWRGCLFEPDLRA